MNFNPTPGPYVPWFNRDQEGRIEKAGVDSKDRVAGIAEILVETSDHYESDDPARHNEIMESDTRLLAASWELLANCEMLLYYYEAFRDKSPAGPTERDDINSVKKFISDLKGADALPRLEAVE